MGELTAERVWEIVEPVWKKHPGTRPQGLVHVEGELRASPQAARGFYLRGQDIEACDTILLCESGLVRWLAGRQREDAIREAADVWLQRYVQQPGENREAGGAGERLEQQGHFFHGGDMMAGHQPVHQEHAKGEQRDPECSPAVSPAQCQVAYDEQERSNQQQAEKDQECDCKSELQHMGLFRSLLAIRYL